MPELPMDLRQLETVGSAFDILKYLDTQPDKAADSEDIMDDLDISSRRFDKAKRRLVTRGYVQMRSDYLLELTRKGDESVVIIKEYGDGPQDTGDGSIQRQLVLTLPRNLVVGQTSPLQIGIEPNNEFQGDANLIVRIETTYADLGDFDEMATLGSEALILDTSITPQNYDQTRIKVEVYMLSAGGDDLKACGGMYIDVAVIESGDSGNNIAYIGNLAFVQ